MKIFIDVKLKFSLVEKKETTVYEYQAHVPEGPPDSLFGYRDANIIQIKGYITSNNTD